MAKLADFSFLMINKEKKKVYPPVLDVAKVLSEQTSSNNSIMRTRSPDKRSRQKLKQGGIQSIQNPETALEYFQISVNILEARKLTWASSQYANSYVVVMLGKEKHRTGIRKNMAEPCYREFFLFEWYATVREVQCTSLWLAVMEPKCCGAPRLVGESTIELATIWAQPNHQVFHKWAQLTLPREPEAGAVGFLKVDISIICREDVLVMPMLGSQNTVAGNMSSALFGAEQQTANYLITIYRAFGLFAGFQNQGDRRIAKPPNTYVKVSFCGLSAKTAVQFRNYNPSYCEQISIVEAFPNICQLIRLDVCSLDTYNKVLGSADIRLEKISHDGENGFVPTFGPALLHMYGFPSSAAIGSSVEEGPFYKGALLVSLKTVVPYYQTGLRSTSVEPVVPLQTDDLWIWEDFSILCTIFEISMLDKNIIGKHCGVALTVSELPCSYTESSKDFIGLMNGIKSKKLYYTKSIYVHKSCPDYGYLDLTSAFPVLQLAVRLPDFRFKIFMNNMVRAIATDLEEALTAIRSELKNNDNVILSHLTDDLRNAVDNAADDMRKFLESIDPFDQKLNEFKRLTDLDMKQLALQKEEIEKIFYQITRKNKDNSIMNLTSLMCKSSRDSCTVTKKEVKSLLAEANYLVLKLRNLVFSSCEGWPDLVIWLLNGTSRVAYCKIPLADAIYSEVPKQSGKLHERIRTLYLKPLKCTKHFSTMQNSCKCISGKIELLSWMGLFKDMPMFDKVLPCNYKLIESEMHLSVKAPTTILICRLFIHRAKLNFGSETSRLPNPFVRANTLNAVKETEPQQGTINPVWNEVVKIKCMVSISRQRLKTCTPSILVEVLDSDTAGKSELLGRVEIQAVVDDRASFAHAPKLQWYDIRNDSEKTGQILMSAQFLEVPETFMKSTNYTSADTSVLSESIQDDILQEYMAPEILPSALMPKPNTYKIDIYWWGLRDVSVSKKPCAVLEIDELCIKSDIISERKPNCNFPNGRTSQIFEAPLNEAYCPPLKIQLCDSSTFGRTLFMGTKVVKSPHKYMVDWLPRYTREASLRSVSVVSANFEKVGDNFFVKKHSPSENPLVCKSNDFGSSQISKKRSFLKSLLCTKQADEEEYVLLPVFCKQKVYAQLSKNSCDGKFQDWWLRFFASLKGRKCDDNNLQKLKIYQSELENQPEFFKFKDWCRTFKLYCDNKTGIHENDQNLHCGNMKAGIAIYKWPPPAETEAVNLNGVKLARGYFDDYPENEPSKFLIRVYIIRGVDIAARSFTGFSDPFVVINCGNKRSENNNRYMTSSSNPVFGKMYEFYCCLPEDYLLTVSLFDHEAVSPDDLIGSTMIDLEDRIYTKHKARVGLATEYKIGGPAKWRDCVKPSAILEEVCLRNHLPPPIFKDNCVTFNDVHYKDIDEKSRTYLSASECKENICLEILHKWHTLPLCGYQMVPEHVETRKLMHPDQPGIDQGKIQMWIDIFPMTAGTYIPIPVDITPRKVEEYELRVVVWSVQGISPTPTDIKRKDIYVKAWIGNEDLTQYTDIHFQSPFGEGNFNWRMIFHFQYQHAEKSVILKEKGPFTEEEEHLPPVLMLHVMDCDAEANKEYLGSILIDLNSIPRGATQITGCKLAMLDTAKRVDLFATRSVRGWWPLKSIDINSGNVKLAGVIDLEMTLLPKETALLMPVGVGRDPPSPLPEPIRIEVQNDSKSSLESICSRGGVELIVIGVIIVGLLVAFYYKFPFSFIHSWIQIRPDYLRFF